MAGLLLLLVCCAQAQPQFNSWLGYNANDATEDHRAHGIEMASDGKAWASVQAFRAAARFTPQESRNWFNLAVALMDT